MATIDKDFKVKNGLNVALGGTFGGTVTVGTPTLGTHAVTKDYVDNLVGGTVSIVFDTVPPESPSNSQFWFDTSLNRLNIYKDTEWFTMATLADAEFLQDHIHDTSIDGSGLIVSIFQDAGYYNQAGALIDSGYYNTTNWTEVWDGGTAIDNFN